MKLGVIGAKLGHTASPAIHEKLFKILQVEGQHQYGVLEMDRNDIPNELQRLRDEGYTGANVTIPYKLDVMPYLTDISREARIIGAVNTIHFTDHGTFGYNTDYGGFGRSWTMPESASKKRTASSSVPAAVPAPSSSTWPTAGPSRLPSYPAILTRRRNSTPSPRPSVPIPSTIRTLNTPRAATSWSTAHPSACSPTSMAVPYRNGSSPHSQLSSTSSTIRKTRRYCRQPAVTAPRP